MDCIVHGVAKSRTRLKQLSSSSSKLGGLVVKSLLAMQEPQETWVQSPSQEDLLEKGTATRSRILACSVPWRSLVDSSLWSCKELDMTEQ